MPPPSSAASGLSRRQALGVMAMLGLPWTRAFAEATPHDAASAPPVPNQSRPDLANLFPILADIAEQNAPTLSFLDSRWSSLEPWKAVARPVLQDRLSYSPPSHPVTAEVIGREERDGFTVESAVIGATSSYKIPARVLVPKGRSGRGPAVLALHCHSGKYTWGHEKVLSTPGEPAHLTEFRNQTYGRPWAEALVRRGYVVIAIDAFYFGARRLQAENLAPSSVFSEAKGAFAAAARAPVGSAEWTEEINHVCSFYEHLTAKTITATGSTWPGIHVWDDRRTIDYLCTRQDVDPDRIGCIGLSGGGFRTAMTIAADARIKAAAVAGWMTEFAFQLQNHLRSHTWMCHVPGLYRSLDLPDAAALHAPGALLVQQCLQDRLYPLAGMKAAVEKLTKIYAKAGLPERFHGSFHDVPHSFRPPMQDEAFDWMARWL